VSEPCGSARGALDVLEYACTRGAERDELLRRMELGGLALADPDARLPLRCYYALLEAAAELLGDPHFGLAYVDQVEPAAIGAVGFLATTSRTLGESIERVIRFHRVLTEGDVFALERAGGVARFTVETFGPARPAHAHVVEMYAFDCLVMGARMTGAPIEVLDFEVRHAPQGPLDGHRRYLGCVPRFGAARNSWSVPADVLDRPLPKADAALARFLEGYVERLDDSLPKRALLEALRAEIGARLVDGALSLDALAAALRQTPRSLQRRLAQQGTSLSAQIDAVRRERACALLGANLALAEVSWLLGFSEPRAFHRAFRRWTGQTPQAWRRAAR
jgi:AraC-like DNA-binding protein